MSRLRRTALQTITPFIAGAFVALAGRNFLAGRKRVGPPTVDPFGSAAGRGVPVTPPSHTALAEGYEVADAHGRALAMTMGIFAASASLAIACCVLALHVFGGPPAAYADFSLAQRHHIDPPAPHLQAAPVTDLSRFEARQNAALARINIARAMALLQGKSLDPVNGKSNEAK
jgi:hypothetical protein